MKRSELRVTSGKKIKTTEKRTNSFLTHVCSLPTFRFLFFFLFFFLFTFFHCSLTTYLHAVPPPPGFTYPDQPTCFVNPQAAKKNTARYLKYAPGFAPPISSTTYKVAVIRIDFTDKTMTKTKSNTETFFQNLKDFYSENSYGYFTVSATVSNGGAGSQGAYQMPRTHAYYANGINSRYNELVNDAIAVATSAGLNFSAYDQIMIYHAGEGAETMSAYTSYIWSVYVPSNLCGGPVASGKTFSGVTIVPESEGSSVDPLGVICHEYGHQLGLPDLYNTGTSPTSSAVGKWSLMDYGIYIGSPLGSNPAHLDAWSKQFLGFSSPETVSYSAGSDKTLAQAETGRTAFIRLPISISDVGGSNEYYLLEYRRMSGASYDRSIPGEGILIWHIDDSIASNAVRISENSVNTDISHRGVDLIEADSSDPSANNGDAADPWYDSLGIFKTPKANAYNGSDSGIEIQNFSGVGTSSMFFSFKNPFNNPAFVNNTSGNVMVSGGANGYTNPNKGEHASIDIVPTGGGRIEVKIYSLAGDLVWETSRTGTANTKLGVTWDAKSTGGTAVSSGIYLLYVNGAGLDIKKKIAIIK